MQVTPRGANGEGDAGREGQGLAAAPRLNGRAGAAALRAETGERAGVVVPGLEIAAQVNLPGEAGYHAVDFVVGVGRCFWVVVVILSDGHKVGDGDYTGASGESGLKYVGVLEVLLPCVNGGSDGTDAEVSSNLRV